MTGYNYGWWGPGCFFGWPWGMLVGILFWALVIYGVFHLFSGLAKQTSVSARKEETPLEILKRRYSKGEIDSEEFAKRKKDLES